MSILSDLASWAKNALSKVAELGSNILHQGLGGITLPGTPGGGSTSNPPGGGGTTGGTGTTAPGSNPGAGSGGSSGNSGGIGSIFSDTVQFFENVTSGHTWLRVGLVALGIVLIVLAVRMLLKAESPIAKTMRAIGIQP